MGIGKREVDRRYMVLGLCTPPKGRATASGQVYSHELMQQLRTVSNPVPFPCSNLRFRSQTTPCPFPFPRDSSEENGNSEFRCRPLL